MEKDKARKKAEMVPGTLDMLIMKTLERNREPMHGYGIAQYLARTTGDVLQVERGWWYNWDIDAGHSFGWADGRMHTTWGGSFRTSS